MGLLRSGFGAFFLACGVLCALSLTVFAAGDEPKWRAITPAELATREPLVEKDADAEAIFWEVRLDAKDFEKVSYEYYARIKIFNERGSRQFARFDVPFTRHRKIEDLAARVIKPDGSIVEVKRADIFEREIVKTKAVKVKAYSFAFSGVEPGAIVEYRYREVRKRKPDELIFEVGGRRYAYEILFTPETKAIDGERLIFQSEIPIQRVTYYVRPYNKEEWKANFYNSPKDFAFAKDADGFSAATMTNVPAFREEPLMPPPNQLRRWALISQESSAISHYNAPFFTPYGDAVQDARKPDSKLRPKAAQIVSGAVTDDQKLAKIYEFVQREIKNLDFDESTTAEQKAKIKNLSPYDTLKNRAGRAVDIEILFAALASAAGFETRVLLAGDKSDFFFEPSLDVHTSLVHYAAIAVRFGENFSYYNPGVPYLPFNKLLWEEDNTGAIIIGKSQVRAVRTASIPYDQSGARRTGNFKLLADGTLEGSIRVEYTGHPAVNRRGEAFYDRDEKRKDDFKDEIKDRIGTAEVSDITLENFDDNAKPLIYAARVRVPGYAQTTGKRLILQPGFFKYNVSPLFSSETRQHPIFLPFGFSETDEIKIQLPAGFALENAEVPSQVADPQQIGLNKISVLHDRASNILIYKRNFHFGKGGKTFFPVKVYPELKKMFDLFHRADSHRLVLRQEAAQNN